MGDVPHSSGEPVSDLTFATAKLATGARLHYAEQGDPAGVPVVCLHGWPDSWFSFSRVLPLLPPRFHVFVPDLRGFGESDRESAAYRIAHFADDVVAFLDAVSVQQAILVGHSFGSFVARQLAATRPDRVARLVLIGTGLTQNNPVLREVEGAMRDLPDPVPLEFAREFQSSTVHAPVPPDFFETILTESLKLPARLWRSVFDAILAFDDGAQWNKIVAPTLMLWGRHDGLFPREHQDRLRGALPNARLVVYDDAGHCPNWERPDRVAADMAMFIENDSPRPAADQSNR